MTAPSSLTMLFSVGEVFNAKRRRAPRIYWKQWLFFLLCSTLTKPFSEVLRKAGTIAKKSHLTTHKRRCFETQAKMGDFGFVSNIIENHDEPRGVSHYIPEGDCCDTSKKKMLAALNFMLRGLPFIYQGQELGHGKYPVQIY